MFAVHIKIDFSVKNFLSKCEQTHRKLRIYSHLLKKSLMENFIFCVVLCVTSHLFDILQMHHYVRVTRADQQKSALIDVDGFSEELGKMKELSQVTLQCTSYEEVSEISLKLLAFLLIKLSLKFHVKFRVVRIQT